MRKSRAKFKLVLCYFREHIEEMKADAYANAVFDKDAKRFWHEVAYINSAMLKQLLMSVLLLGK